MKVKPFIKHRPLRDNEARVITIKEGAIAELLRENLMDNGYRYFDLPEETNNGDDLIFVTNWNQKNNLLTYIVLSKKTLLEGFDLNIDSIVKSVGITTDSLYRSKRYQSIVISEKTDKTASTGDGFA